MSPPHSDYSVEDLLSDRIKALQRDMKDVTKSCTCDCQERIGRLEARLNALEAARGGTG